MFVIKDSESLGVDDRWMETKSRLKAITRDLVTLLKDWTEVRRSK